MKRIVLLVALFFCTDLINRPPTLHKFTNTCYINASLQALYAINPLTNIVVRQDFDQLLAAEYKKLLIQFQINKDKRKWRIPARMLKYFVDIARDSIRRPGEEAKCTQEDAEEFIRILMKQLSTKWSIQLLIQTLLREKFYHTIFGEETFQYEGTDEIIPQFIISLPLTGVRPRTNLEVLVNTLFSLEGIESRTPEEITVKQTFLTNYPLILAFSLKRFSFDPVKKQPVKIPTEINIPLELDMSTHYTGKEDPIGGVYELRSAVIHRGEKPSGGHYIAYVKEGDQWYLCDDTTITRVTLATVRQKIRPGYIFFYQKKAYGEREEEELEIIGEEEPIELAEPALIDNLLALRANLEELLENLKELEPVKEE